MSQQPLNSPQSAPNIDVKAPTSAVQGVSVSTPSPQAPQSPQADPRLEQLARKERALSRQMREFQATKAAFEAEKKSLLPKDQWKQQFMRDPTALGLSYQEISERFLQQPSPEQMRETELKREIEELRSSQQAAEQRYVDGQKKAYEQAKQQISGEVSSLVDTNPDYSLVKALGYQDSVVELIEEILSTEGKLITTEEAVSLVQGELRERLQGVAGLENAQPKTQAAEQVPTAPVAPQGPQGPQLDDATKQALVNARARNKERISVSPRMPTHPTTLTNAMSQQSSVSTGNTSTPRERAILAAMGKLTG